MSITLLLEKYDVSTEEGLQKAFNEIDKEESEVDDALSGALSRACALEGRLRTASQAYTKLGEMKTDAQAASDMVERTAALARDVSAKVRQLDLARSRVAECQLRVHDLIDLQLCSSGVQAAIKAQDYETGAAHVSRFLSMDPGSVAAARARGASDPRDTMLRAADTLHEQLVRKFEEASRKNDEAAVDRLFELFPQIGRADEGVDLLAKYLAKNLEATLRRTCTVESGGGAGGAEYADALTRVLEAGGAAVERVRGAAGARGRLPRALGHIQPAVCAGARRVVTALVGARGTGPPDRRDPLLVEPGLAELALAHSRIDLYFGFLRRRAESDASTATETDRENIIAAVEKIIAESDLTRTAQDLLSQYLTLERYFLEESVNKALRLSGSPATEGSSLVDDVFFIARKVIRRSVETGSVDAVCVVLNEVCALLERDVAGALRRALRSAPAHALPLAGPPHAHATAPAVTLLAQRLTRDLDAQRLSFLAHVNEAEAGAEWAGRLAEAACAGAGGLARGAGERDKLHSCAGGLAGAATAFRAAHELGAAALRASLRAPLLAWADALTLPAHNADDTADEADSLPAALDALSEAARGALSGPATEGLLTAIVGDIVTRADHNVMHNTYTREEGLRVERRVRRLSAWCGGSAAGARERCARLTQMGALLSLEALHHAPDVLRPARLAPDCARDVLARRIDFKMEDIKKLKL